MGRGDVDLPGLSAEALTEKVNKIKIYTDLRPSYNGIIQASQACDAGSTPVGRFYLLCYKNSLSCYLVFFCRARWFA